MDNNHDMIRQLVKFYETKRLLWDSKHPDYYNKNKREDMWREISLLMNVSVKELKKKMTSLLGSYRRERSREKKSQVTGSVTRPSEANVMGNNNAKSGKVGDKKKSKTSDNVQEAVETCRNEITAEKCEQNSVSEEIQRANNTNDKSTITEIKSEPKKESYVKQLFDVRKKRKDNESTRIGAPISRYLPHFTVHFASIAFRNYNRTRDLKNCTVLDQKDLSENVELAVDELKSKLKEKNTNVRRILKEKAKSVDCFPQYRKDYLSYEDNLIFTPLKIREDSDDKKNQEDQSRNVNAGPLVDFGKYSPKISREQIKKVINDCKINDSTQILGNSSSEISADGSQLVIKRNSDEIQKTYESKTSYPNNTSLLKTKNVDSKLINQTVNDLKIKNTYIPSNARCKQNNDDKIIVYVETPGIKKTKSLNKTYKDLTYKNDSKESTTDQTTTGERTNWSSKRTTKIDEFSKIHYPKETRQAFMVMISDMKKSQLESENVNVETYKPIEENIRKFNNMCKTDKSEDEDDGKLSQLQRQRNIGEMKSEENTVSRKTSRVEIKSLYKRDDTKNRSESSLSKGISCRSIFYDKSKKDIRQCRNHKRNRNKSPSICKRNSSSFIESCTSLSTNISYCQVQRLFQSIITESKTGRLKRFRRNISGYKEMDRLGLGTWENKQWRPSDSKAYTIYNRFQKNVNGFQGDFNKCKRKIE